MAKAKKNVKSFKRHFFKRGKEDENCRNMKHCGSGGCAYFLGFLGALVYNLQITTGFWASILGILKAAVWPAFLVYKLFSM